MFSLQKLTILVTFETNCKEKNQMNVRRSRAGEQSSSFLFELDEFLPYRLSLLTNTVSAGIARSYRDQYEISVTEWRIMAVQEPEGMTTAPCVPSKT